jgi:hypothetical protein
MTIHEKSFGKQLEPKFAPNNGNNLQRLVRKLVSPLIATSDQPQKVRAFDVVETVLWKNNSCGLNKIQFVYALIMMKITGVTDSASNRISLDSLSDLIAAYAV